MYGWTGWRLVVDLSRGKIGREQVPAKLRSDFLGGRGMNARTLWDELEPGVDPLGPDNVIIVGIGPLAGSIAPASSRWTVTAKSPLTGVFGDGNGGGDFAAELKYAGYDQIIVRGRSPSPVYLWVKDGKAELRDASGLWGNTTVETHRKLVEELGDNGVREICIGPAGENKVRFASVVGNLSKPAARSGMGAVMGSKNLKAIVVRGTGSIELSNPDETAREARAAFQKLRSHPFFAWFRETGTLPLIASNSMAGTLGTRYYQTVGFEGAEKLTPEIFKQNYDVKHKGCFACPMHESHYYEVKGGPYATRGEGMEFGAISPFCSQCGNDDFAAALYASALCDQLGLDTISCGGTIAFAMMCWQKGLITRENTDGLDLSWGNADTMVKLVRKIAYREGFGNLLADGVRRVSWSIEGSESFAMHVKGQEWVVNCFRDSKGCALGFGTSSRGADHLKGLVEPERWHLSEDDGQRLFGEMLGNEKARSIVNPRAYLGKGTLLAIRQNLRATVDSLEFCHWVTEGFQLGMLSLDDLARLFTAITGVDMDRQRLVAVGERTFNVERAFNIREGLRRKDDLVPSRMFKEAIPRGPNAGELIDPVKYQEMLDEYYESRGWDKEGIPMDAKLNQLGLDDMTVQMERCRRTC